MLVPGGRGALCALSGTVKASVNRLRNNKAASGACRDTALRALGRENLKGNNNATSAAKAANLSRVMSKASASFILLFRSPFRAQAQAHARIHVVGPALSPASSLCATARFV